MIQNNASAEKKRSPSDLELVTLDPELVTLGSKDELWILLDTESAPMLDQPAKLTTKSFKSISH